MSSTESLPVLERRRVEAGLLSSVARVLEEELGAERAGQLLRRAVAEAAEEQGRMLQASLPERGLAGVDLLWRGLAEGGALSIDVEERTATTFRFRVTRCRYAEMYREAGLQSIGRLLSCGRDLPLLRGFAPELTMERTECLLEGGSCCQFTYRAEPERK